MTSVATYRSSQELYSNLVLRELRSKYKRSFLGWTWSLANPLATMVVYTLVFKYFLHIKPAPGESEWSRCICVVFVVRACCPGTSSRSA